jgi:malonate-semialdehyde dehydrogenase (acetylating) / methylmalonate-semialdehyde dehydrogenase
VFYCWWEKAIILEKIIAEAQKIQAGINLGSVISPKAKDRIEGYITRAEKNGAHVLLDGRNAFVKGKENGTYVNPTIIEGVTPSNECACDEIFGPVLTVLRVNTLEEALAIENGNPYGNAAAIYTTNGTSRTLFFRGMEQQPVWLRRYYRYGRRSLLDQS